MIAALQSSSRTVRRQMSVNQDAIPSSGEDQMFLQLAKQILDATKINQHDAADATERYNAAIAALRWLISLLAKETRARPPRGAVPARHLLGGHVRGRQKVPEPP